MSVFKIFHNDEEQVVLKVKKLKNFEIALNPYISGNYDYITVTKGMDHVLTVIEKDGNTFSFKWGYHGYTLISDNLERLKREVVKFIESQNISLGESW